MARKDSSVSAAERAARLTLSVGRAAARLLPRRLREAIDDRVFGAVFQVTRVTNDHYGWRPDGTSGGGGSGEEESREDGVRAVEGDAG